MDVEPNKKHIKGLMKMGEIKQVFNDPELLVQRYFDTKRPDLKDEILGQFAPTVERVARKFAGIEPFEDLCQVGRIGLLNAIGKFDPEAGVRFGTYATHLIAGEIKHYLRDKSQIIRHPAWLQELRHKVTKGATRLQAEFGRPATPTEIAYAIGVPVSQVEEVIASGDSLKVSSFDAALPGDDDSSEIDNMPAYTNDSEGVEERLVLESALGKLRDLEREVLTCFHFESLTQTEISNKLGISCNYVSHILRQSLSKLRRILTSEESEDILLQEQGEHPAEKAITDRNTGFYTEAHFKNRLNEETHRAKSHESPLALVMLRFDGLDSLRSYYGNECVADFLADAADFCREQIRRLDVPCVVGNQGFAIILPMTGPTASVLQARLMAKLKPWLTHRRGPMGAMIEVRCGYSYLSEKCKTAKHLVSQAEAALNTPSHSVVENRAA